MFSLTNMLKKMGFKKKNLTELTVVMIKFDMLWSKYCWDYKRKHILNGTFSVLLIKGEVSILTALHPRPSVGFASFDICVTAFSNPL